MAAPPDQRPPPPPGLGLGHGSSTPSSRPPSPSPSQLPPVPGSPVYSIASTAAQAASHFSLPLPPAPRAAHAVLRKADLEHSQEAYAQLAAAAKAYRVALASLSTAASAFAAALEACARLKEARAEPLSAMAMSTTATTACTADPLLSASGVHHLVANHQQILSDTVYRSFEVPLLHDLDRWRTVIEDEAVSYQHKIKAQSREVKRLEKEGLKLHRQPRRHVARFRAHLVDLTTKLDGLTTLHADHARTLLRESQDTSARIVDASCSLVRAEVDMFESLARKGWSGGGLDDLLDRGHDLFASDDAGGAASNPAGPAKLFSILPPKSILADSASDASRLDHDDGAAARDEDDDDDGVDGLLSLTASASASNAGTSTADSASSASSAGTVTAVAPASSTSDGAAPRASSTSDGPVAPSPTKPRPPRPFSPQPIRRIPTDVTFESLGALAAPAPAPRRDAGRRPSDDPEPEPEPRNAPDETAETPSPGADLPTWQERGRQPSQSPAEDRRASSPGPATTDPDQLGDA